MVKRLSIFFVLLMILSCDQDKRPIPAFDSYFSVIGFARDQFEVFHGQPFTLVRTVTTNGVQDSVMLSVLTMDWRPVLEPFFRSDISAREFQGKYDFQVFDDDATVSRIYFYEAKNDELYTRSLQVVTDLFTGKIRSIFVETKENSWVRSRHQKLYYAPLRLIQIQQTRSGLFERDEHIVREYRFLN